MISTLKSTLRKFLSGLPFAVTQNIGYDQQTKYIIQHRLPPHANTVDIGCHKGEILDLILKRSPAGQHFAFEPLPDFFQALRAKYQQPNIHLFETALSDYTGSSSFNYVVSHPAYSGLKKRTYDAHKIVENTIEVQVRPLDSLIPHETRIDFIKIDVEGGELGVLRGATRILDTYHPLVIFEHGLGASDHYGTGPEEVFRFLSNLGYAINTMRRFLDKKEALTEKEFSDKYFGRVDFYYIAYVQ